MKHRFIGVAVGLAVVPLAAAAGGSSVFAAGPPAHAQVGATQAKPVLISSGGNQSMPIINPGGPKLPPPPGFNPGGPNKPGNPPPPQHPVNPGAPDRPGHQHWGRPGHRDWEPGHHPEPRHWSDHDSDWNYWYSRGFQDGWCGASHRHGLGGERQDAYNHGYDDGHNASDND